MAVITQRIIVNNSEETKGCTCGSACKCDHCTCGSDCKCERCTGSEKK